MKIPEGCSVSMEVVPFNGPFRPKNFFKITVECKTLGMSVSRHVLAGPLLLRVRLWVALHKALKTVRKAEKFRDNQIHK